MINSTLTAYVFCIYKGNMIAVYKFKAVFRFMTPISYLKYLNRSRGRPFVKTSANWFWLDINLTSISRIYELFSDEMVRHVDVF